MRAGGLGLDSGGGGVVQGRPRPDPMQRRVGHGGLGAEVEAVLGREVAMLLRLEGDGAGGKRRQEMSRKVEKNFLFCVLFHFQTQLSPTFFRRRRKEGSG